MEDELVLKLSGIAFEFGVSEATMKRWLQKSGVKLPKWGKGKTNLVYMARCGMWELYRRFIRSGVIKGAEKQVRVGTRILERCSD